MIRRRNIRSKKQKVSSKKVTRRVPRRKQTTSTATSSIVKHHPSENLDDETKLAKRHLTKEMWQLISIAVKRMADELVSISNNQQTSRIGNHELPTTLVEIKTDPERSTSTTTIQQLKVTNTGAGDEPFLKETLMGDKELIKRRTSPLQLLEPSVNTKKKGSSNNAKRQSIKSGKSKKILKKNHKTTTQPLRNNRK